MQKEGVMHAPLTLWRRNADVEKMEAQDAGGHMVRRWQLMQQVAEEEEDEGVVVVAEEGGGG